MAEFTEMTENKRKYTKILKKNLWFNIIDI